MATLGVVVNHKRAPITTQQTRLVKGVEQFYYALLFSSSPSYANRADAWRSWLSIGFHVATKVPPPGTAESDRVTMTVRSNGKAPEINGSSSNREALQKLQKLLQDIDALRGSVAGKDEASRAEALLGNTQVAQQLVKPVIDALNRSALRQDEIDSYMGMIRRGLLALTHDEITSIQFSLN